MKPFSKNLFSQTPVAFGWLPKETINLDISNCVCVPVCVYVGSHVLQCVLNVSGRPMLLCGAFFGPLSQAETYMSKSSSIWRLQQGRQPRKNKIIKKKVAWSSLPKLWLTPSVRLRQRQTSAATLITCPSFLSSFYTFSPTGSLTPPQNILLCQHLANPRAVELLQIK